MNTNKGVAMKNLIAVVCMTAVSLAAIAAPAKPPKLNEGLLKEAFSSLKDPDSAKFKDIKYSSSTAGIWNMCGYVNAKNSYGGYVGFKRFYGLVTVIEGRPIYAVTSAEGDIADEMCAQKGL